MLSIPQDILIILAAIVASLGFWWLVRWIWAPERRRVHNEITGWQLSVLGTTYAVIIGFMLFAVWSDFGAAEAQRRGGVQLPDQPLLGGIGFAARPA